MHSDFFLAVEGGDIDRVVEIITSKGISPTVKNEVRIGTRDLGSIAIGINSLPIL